MAALKATGRWPQGRLERVSGRCYTLGGTTDPKREAKQIIFSAKAGRVTAAHVRDLRGVVERENAAFGVLISLEEPTRPMRAEAASGELYESPGWNKKYPRLQLLTIAELLQGKRDEHPPSRAVAVTFKKAPREKRGSAESGRLEDVGKETSGMGELR